MGVSYVLGLDLGQVQDFTALAVIERPTVVQAGEKPVYSLRHLQRFELGMPYTEVVPEVLGIARSEPLKGSPVVTDQTGVGRAVVDLFRYSGGGLYVVPVTITAGQEAHRDDKHNWHVPKKDLVGCLQVVLQSGRLRLPSKLPLTEVLVKELHSFQVKITLSANETFGSWREGSHDDLVLALALACWWADRHPPWTPGCIGYGRSVVDDAPPGVFGPGSFRDPPPGVFHTKGTRFPKW